MSELLHRIKIFVYRLSETQPDYLLLKSQGYESMWGPLQASLGFGEKLEGAIRRRVLDDTGMTPPGQLIDLQMPSRWTVGDEEIVEWTFGFQSITQPDPRKLEERWANHIWAGFGQAYPSLGFDYDRAAIMRLHALLSAA